MTRRALLWFAMVAAPLGAAPALAETQPDHPRNPDVAQKWHDAKPKAEPGQTRTKPPVCRSACSRSSSGRAKPPTH